MWISNNGHSERLTKLSTTRASMLRYRWDTSNSECRKLERPSSGTSLRDYPKHSTHDSTKSIRSLTDNVSEFFEHVRPVFFQHFDIRRQFLMDPLPNSIDSLIFLILWWITFPGNMLAVCLCHNRSISSHLDWDLPPCSFNLCIFDYSKPCTNT